MPLSADEIVGLHDQFLKDAIRCGADGRRDADGKIIVESRALERIALDAVLSVELGHYPDTASYFSRVDRIVAARRQE